MRNRIVAFLQAQPEGVDENGLTTAQLRAHYHSMDRAALAVDSWTRPEPVEGSMLDLDHNFRSVETLFQKHSTRHTISPSTRKERHCCLLALIMNGPEQEAEGVSTVTPKQGN